MKFAGKESHSFGAMAGLVASLFLGALAGLPALAATDGAKPLPTVTAPATTAPSAPAPAAAASPTPSAPAAAPDQPLLTAPDAPGPKPGIDNAQKMDLTAQPALVIHGTAKWDDGFTTLMDAFRKINAQIATAKLTAKGAPLAVFLDTSDDGFTYDALVPLTAAPPADLALTDNIKAGETPTGKTVRFEHRASYQDIDDTYEALTAWLDERELVAQDKFMEEFLTIPKDDEDDSLKVDIYVFLK
ncbi:MAG: GyrI-like domain-containing protein [Hyphomicrobiales bacterium]|nr:GyrI-like domain-containing protein [Hyphomicrobiales bacterium]MDE2114373.1 GyrI-like domain-containing protein [Hyphomicrobiales bacterium]